ncbi:VOC family protein [Streptomyces sp. NPDC059037]|uniref:VOC family protein n=1 Tax=Streptomyces sp. NPDC059037 TaxID=3346710 RepID=UPI0036C2BDD0
MSVALRVVEIECVDPIQLGQFWSAALQTEMGPGSDGVNVPFPGSDVLLYLKEGRSQGATNCVRLHLNPQQRSLVEEVERLQALGANVVKQGWQHRGFGLGLTLMADPEGNEFYVQASDKEVAVVQDAIED